MSNSPQKILFHVFSRETAGSNSAKKLRDQGKVIGNVYGLGADSTGVYMDKQAIRKLYASSGDTGLIYLQIGDSKKQVPVLISEYQTDPYGVETLHVSFRRVDLTEPIEADISVHITGEANIPDSVISLVKDFVTVEALPANLPEKFEIDISGLTEIGQTISLANLDYNAQEVKLILEEEQTPEDVLLVIVQEIAGEVPESDTPETETEVGKEADAPEAAPEKTEKSE